MLDLTKLNTRKQLVLDLSKSKGIENQKAQVVVCMDISGSMRSMYVSGFVQRVLERIVPVAMQFDDNGEMELYLFQDTCKKHPNNITVNNVDGIVNREIWGKYQTGSTNYAPPLKMITYEAVGSTNKVLSFFKSTPKKKLTYPVYVIFITDGNNFDKDETESILRDASNYGLFFQFVGIGRETFSFLKKLDNLSGRFIDNANFFQVADLDKETDQDLYSKLLNEFPQWIQLAKSKDLIS